MQKLKYTCKSGGDFAFPLEYFRELANFADQSTAKIARSVELNNTTVKL